MVEKPNPFTLILPPSLMKYVKTHPELFKGVIVLENKPISLTTKEIK